MSPNILKIADGISLPSDAATQSITILAKRRVGKSCGYTNNLSALRSSGLISYPAPNTLALTFAGRDISFAPIEPLDAWTIRERVKQLLSNPQRRIIDALVDVFPQDLSREELAEKSGQSAISSGFTNNLSSLRSFGFIEYSSAGRVIAADMLFIQL